MRTLPQATTLMVVFLSGGALGAIIVPQVVRVPDLGGLFSALKPNAVSSHSGHGSADDADGSLGSSFWGAPQGDSNARPTDTGVASAAASSGLRSASPEASPDEGLDGSDSFDEDDGEASDGTSAGAFLAELEAAYLRIRLSEAEAGLERAAASADEAQELAALAARDAEAALNARADLPATRTAGSGDHIAGDKVEGDKVSGDKVEVASLDQSQNQQIQQITYLNAMGAYGAYGAYGGYGAVNASEAPQNVSGQANVSGGQTAFYAGTQNDDGSGSFVGYNLDANRVPNAYSTGVPVRAVPSGARTTRPAASSHQRSPWDPIDYSGHHNPWQTGRIP